MPTSTGLLPRRGNATAIATDMTIGKDERPEQRLGLADELAHARQRRARQRQSRHRGHSSRRCRPVSAMNTSSSVPCCVTTVLGAPSEAIRSCRRPERDHAAVIDDGHAVAEDLGFIHVVRRQQHRAARVAEPAQRCPRAGGATADRGRSSARRGTAAPGLPASAHASASRCFWPPDSLPTQLARLRFELHDREQLLDRAAPVVERAEQAQGLLDGELVRRAAFPGAGCRAAGAARRSSRRHVMPSTSTSPASGGSRPSRISIVVVLPAPFGPSRPKHSPRSTASERPSTATTSP